MSKQITASPELTPPFKDEGLGRWKGRDLPESQQTLGDFAPPGRGTLVTPAHEPH